MLPLTVKPIGRRLLYAQTIDKGAGLTSWVLLLYTASVMPGYFLNSGILFRQAKAAFERTAAAPSENEPGQDDALVAILFSAASLEAWIGEIRILASSPAFSELSSHIGACADLIAETEDSRGSIRLKYLLVKNTLTGKSYNKGASPYQDFHLLFSVRDALVHMRPEKIAEKTISEKSRTDKLVRALALKRLCIAKTPGIKSSWLSKISTGAVERWSCNVAVDMVDSICDGLRIHTKHPALIDILKSSFRHIETR